MFSRESPKLCPVGRGKINTDLPDGAGGGGHDMPTELRKPRKREPTDLERYDLDIVGQHRRASQEESGGA